MRSLNFSIFHLFLACKHNNPGERFKLYAMDSKTCWVCSFSDFLKTNKTGAPTLLPRVRTLALTGFSNYLIISFFPMHGYLKYLSVYLTISFLTTSRFFLSVSLKIYNPGVRLPMSNCMVPLLKTLTDSL